MLTKIDEIEKQVLDYNFKMSEHSEIIKKMLYFQPKTKVVTIPYCGHAPSLMIPDQIKIIEEWLKEI